MADAEPTPPCDSPQNQALHRNIPKYFVAMAFRNLWVSMPIGILYYLDRGLTYFQMGVIEAIIGLTIILSDIPSGAFADIFGRKLSTGLGMGLWGLSLILTGLSTQYFMYLIAAVIMGFGDSLISGAEKALFYDTLKQLGREDRFIQYIGRRDILTAISIILASIFGAILYSINITLPFYAHGGANLVAAACFFAMQEPTLPHTQKTIKAQYQLILHSLRFTWQSPKIRFLTVFSILLLIVPMGFVNLMEQAYLVEIRIPILYFGLIFALTRGVIGFFGPFRYKIERWLGEKRSFYAITFVFGGMFLCMAFFIHPIAVGLLFFLFFTRDYSWSILDKYANDHIPSEKRATILSIMNFGLNLVFSGGAIFIGVGLDGLHFFGWDGIRSVLLLLGVFCIVVLAPFLFFNYKDKPRFSPTVG